MTKTLGSLNVLDKSIPTEVNLELLSFSGGENTIATDQERESNEADLIENWDAISIGGLIRSKGYTILSDGGESYSEDVDLLIQHKDGDGTLTYAIVEGDLLYNDSGDLTLSDDDAFTSGELCHAVSAGEKLWITNTTDNLKYATVAGGVASPTDAPDTASARIYEHNSRLIAEGNSANTVYGSVVGKGNWAGANGWTTSGNAWSMVMPEETFGCMPGFPSGTDVTVFTEHDTYVIYNIPNVARRRVQNGIGCGAALSIARGNEGVFFLSTYPTLGIFLWNGTQYINLTKNHDFVNDINLSGRIFGIYKDQEYWFIYNETGSGVTYPNRIKIYNTKFGRWKSRPVNMSDTLGYPAINIFTDESLIIGSSQTDKVYTMLDSSDSDNGANTEASYKTKVFTSRDFRTVDGSIFPIDNVRLKLLSVTALYKGAYDSWGINWTSDRGLHTGSQSFEMSAGTSGALINTTFTVNTSSILSFDNLTNKLETRSFNNSAVGREFQFEITNRSTGLRAEIKKIKIKAIILDEV